MNSDDVTAITSIVLIDDDEDFLHVMKRRLEIERPEYSPRGGVMIRTFTDPVEALVNLPADGICVVFLDYNLQDSTGLEWLPKLTKVAPGPIILLTNQNDVRLAAEAFRNGAADYLAKGELLTDDNRLGKAIREACHRYRLELRNALLTRQLKLVNAELGEKNARLQELTATAHQYVDDVAHDFRTPLTVIEQYALILADGLSGPVTDRQREHLEIVAEATRDLSDMVDDFLDTSKLRSKALPIERERHTVQELFESSQEMLLARGQSRQIHIEHRIPSDLPSFFADLSKASRVLVNLAVNAIKVTPTGGTLRLSAESTQQGDVRVSVTDSGPGLKPEDLSLIFDRFQQLGEPKVTEGKGFGIGLSIVKYLTWLNLGVINVESEPGKGSSFSFTLPQDNLDRILTCYLQTVKTLPKAGDLWMLRVRSNGSSSRLPALKRFVASSCYATDLVLPADHCINLLGVCSDPDSWKSRLRACAERVGQPMIDLEPIELDIKTEGSWVLKGETEELCEALKACLCTRSLNVEANSIG